MRAVITVVGKDTLGIIAKISEICAENRLNIVDISQSVLREFFCMIMIVDISKSTTPFSEIADTLNSLGKDMGLSIHAMHEDIFNSMHRI